MTSFTQTVVLLFFLFIFSFPIRGMSLLCEKANHHPSFCCEQEQKQEQTSKQSTSSSCCQYDLCCPSVSFLEWPSTNSFSYSSYMALPSFYPPFVPQAPITLFFRPPILLESFVTLRA